MSGLPQVEADLGAGSTAAGRTQVEFDDNLLLPALYGGELSVAVVKPKAVVNTWFTSGRRIQES